MNSPGRATLAGGPTLPHAVARHLLDHHAARLPDLSALTVLVPNHRAGQDFARVLALAAALPALVPPQITPLKSWAQARVSAAAEPDARRLTRLHGVLRHADWLGSLDRWALAGELLQLADELSAARLGDGIGAQLRARHADALDRETALIEAVWRTLNSDGRDPQARYARGLDACLAEVEARPRPIYGYALGPLTAVEQQFLDRCAAFAPVTLFELATDANAPVAHTLQRAWQQTEPPLRERAAALAADHHDSPLASRITLSAAPHLEAEARAVATWVATHLRAGRRDLALIALDREAARRVRALLDRLGVRTADETGWTLSTTAAAAVIDRWLECVANDFPHVELLDLLKSPFALGDPAAREDAVLAFELALRRHGVSRGMGDMLRLAHATCDALPDWLATLFGARQDFAQGRTTLAGWLTRLLASLDAIGAIAPLAADAAGAKLLETLATLRADLAGDAEKYSLAEWRRWLDLALESASFIDDSIVSPVVLTSLPAARGRVFDAIALIGADAQRLPARPAPGLFSQSTRAALGLPTAREAADAATTDLVQLLTQGPALLSWQAWHDDEPNPASPLVLRLEALHQAAWGHDLPAQPSGMPPTIASVLPAPGAQPAPSVDAAQLPRRYTPTAYQTLLDCPYRFFVARVLGLRELDEADDALDKRDYGDALHRILHAFHEGAPPAERDAALDRLHVLSEAEFAALPAFTAAAWRARWAAIEAAYIDAWLDWTRQGWRYHAGEAVFEQPFRVAALGDIVLHGRVDRVDERPGLRAVIDYKTSAAGGLKRKLRQPDESVQLPFYAWLADAAAVYLPINETPVAPLELDGETDVDAIVRRLPELLGAIVTGAPLTANGVEAVCQYCEARGLCRKGMWHG